MKPLISVVIPVFRETGSIEETLISLHEVLSGQAAEILIVDGDPAGGTIGTIRHNGIRTLIAPKGRGSQMNAGAASAEGAVLLFLHADTRLPAGAADLILDTLANPAIAGGAFSLGIRSHRRIYRWIEAAATVRSRLTRIPYGDQSIFIRRSVFFAVGGYADVAIMEDIDLMRRLKRAGRRIRLLPQRSDTSCRRWEKEGPVFCTLRNTLISSLYYIGVPAEKLASFYP